MSPPMLEWKPGAPGSLLSEKDGTKLEIARQIDGTHWLKVWPAPHSSKIAGIFANVETAKFAAENLPPSPDYASIARDPHGGVKFGGTK